MKELPKSGFMRIKDVLIFYPVSRSTWLAGVRDGRYPAAYKLSPKTTAWKATDIQTLIDETQQQR